MKREEGDNHMLEKVKAIVAEGLGVDAADLTEETTF